MYRNSYTRDVLPAADARIARTRRAVAGAVAAILAEEGAGAVTHQRVAERAGVGRATLYRHWPNPGDLLYDALGEVEEPLLRKGEGPLVPWLTAELRRASIEVGQPGSVQFLSVLVARAAHDPEAADLRRRLIERSVVPLAAAVSRAVERGEVVGEPDAHDLLARLVGPIIFRVVLEGSPASDRFIDQTIAEALAPWLPTSGYETV